MKGLLCLMLAFVWTLPAQQVWFSDDFESDPHTRLWASEDSAWMSADGHVRIDTRSYDQLFASDWNITADVPYTITVRLRGQRAGIFFCLDRPNSKELSQMVRFDGTSLLAGSFDGAGVFQATTTIALKDDPARWSDLAITVNPPQRTYTISVNGKKMGEAQPLKFSSGFVGLQASDGMSEFDRITIAGPEGRLQIPPGEVGTIPVFRHVEWVQMGDEGLEIYDHERQVFLVLDSEGRLLRTRRGSAPDRRTSVVVSNTRFEISGKAVVITDSLGRRDTLAGSFVRPWSLCRAAAQDIYVADVGKCSIVRLSASGRMLGEFRAAAIGGLKAPRGLAVDGHGGIVVADYDRLVFTDTTLTDVLPEIRVRTAHSATVRWNATGATDGRARYCLDGGNWETVPGALSADGRRFEATFGGLKSLARYSFTVQPALRTIPRESSVSAVGRFVTQPEDPSHMAFTRLPVMCMIYRTMSTRDRYPAGRYPQIPAGRTLTDQDLDALRQAVRFNEEFYFRNSSCTLALQFDLFVVEDTLWLGEVGSHDPYFLEPGERVQRDFETAAKKFGHSPSFYNGLVVPYAWVNYPSRRPRPGAGMNPDSISIRQAYGGGTYGVPGPWAYGATSGYTGNPFPDRFSRQDWLITHEFHHQLDALMEASGYRDYFHADMPWVMPGRFGEDFDFNAAIMRRAPLERWLSLAFGSLESTPDADHDGVPDEDPSLPFDERRLNGSPGLMDTDHDSWADLEEVMAGTSRGSGLDVRDTDGDHILDGNDSEPLYPFSPERRRFDGSPRWDFGTIETATYRARFSLEWDDQDLLLFCESTAPVNLLFQIDARNDGWFHGFDNVQIRIDGRTDSLIVLDYYLRDCSSWVDPPRDRKDILNVEELAARLEIDSASGLRRIVLSVPRLAAYGLTLRRGDALAVRIGTQTIEDRWVWDELLERNAMMTVILQ